MIDNLSPTIDFPPHPPMMSMYDLTLKAYGPVGPVIFFRDPRDPYCGPDLDPVQNSSTGA